MTEQVFWNPFCGTEGPFADAPRFDFSDCFTTTIISSIPFSLLFLVGGLSLTSLVRNYTSGNTPEKGGKGAYRSKLVSCPFNLLRANLYIFDLIDCNLLTTFFFFFRLGLSDWFSFNSN